MKGIFGPYVLLPFDKKLIFKLVMRIRTHDYMVSHKNYKQQQQRLQNSDFKSHDSVPKIDRIFRKSILV